MSDHIDGPRTIADPAIDLTDLFAFQSPENPSRIVIAADVYPFAGETGFFSNAANYSLILKRVKRLGLGTEAGFESFGEEKRITFQFDPLARADKSEKSAMAQAGVCILPSGERILLTVGDEKGAYNAARSVRVFAGVRSDPFYIGWVLNTLKAVPNYLQNDNVMALVVELAISDLFPVQNGSLLGLVAETSPRNRGPETLEIPRYDWVGRPEQTNFVINAIPNTVDLRDLWNQQKPFAPISALAEPILRQRLTDSFRFWDKRDDAEQWNKEELNAHVNVRMNDFLVFDHSKPITDSSHLEIEKSTIAGQEYKTGGGRTIDANVIDILVTYLINRDQGKFYQSPAKQATQKGLKQFPYFAPPNRTVLKVSQEVSLPRSPREVWALIGQFGAAWHPMMASIRTVGTGIGQLRIIETIEGKEIVERLDSIDNKNRTLNYSLVSGIPADPYTGTIQVKQVGQSSVVSWTVNYRPSGQGDLIVHMVIEQLIESGLKGLQRRYGVQP